MTHVITISMLAARELESSLPDMPIDENVITTDNQIACGTILDPSADKALSSGA